MRLASLAVLLLVSLLVASPRAISQPVAPAGGAASAEISAPEADTQQRLQQIDAMVTEKMASLNMPAYTLTVIKSGKVVFKKAYGFADLDTQQPTTSDTVFGLASLTKTFTALTLLSLVDKGLVALDDPLSKYIDGLTPPYQPLTIRQLASMIAGVPSKVSQEVEWKDQLGILDSMPLVSQPGSEYLYSNFSYRLIGSVINKVTGRNYLAVVRDTIFAPLNMQSSGTTVLLNPTGRVASAYGDDQGKGPLRRVPYKDPAVSFSAGMLASTQNDLINYVFGLMSHQIISEQGYKTLWYDRPPLTTGKPSHWAFGWGSKVNKDVGGLTVSMNGGTPGVASTIIIMPEEKNAVIALCNLRKPPVYAVARNAFNIAFGTQSDPQETEQATGSDSD